MPAPSPSAHQVLVYSGPGVSPLSLSHTILTLSLLLLPHYTVQPVTPEVLNDQPWEPSCALLVIPGGRDLPFVEELTVKRAITRRIKEYVDQGGRYLGICAGGYFGTSEVRFDVGGPMQVIGPRDLAFFPGASEGPTFPGFQYASEAGSRAVSLFVENATSSSSSSNRVLDYIYYNGGGHFVLPSPVPSNVQVLARYAEAPASATTSESERTAKPVAAVLTKNGKGRTVLCALHPEYPLYDPPARLAIAKLDHVPEKEEIERSDKARIGWVEDLLVLLGLDPPSRKRKSDHDGIVQTEGEEDPALLLHPTHPSPIFALSHPNLPGPSTRIVSKKELSDKMTKKDGWDVLRDGNDEINFGPIESTAHASSSTSTSDSEVDLTHWLAQKRRDQPIFEPPPIENLKLDGEGATPPPPQAPDFHSLTKTLLLPSSTIPYSPSWTPLFNFSTYWSELDAARKRGGRRSGVLRNEKWSLGDLLLYGETVTSTQTMLDRNPLLLTHLPSPLAFLASFQLSGRGRGSNIWLSPPGCLQFSLLLDLPAELSSKMVFIQYIMALAVCEAVDEDGRLGVRIKWPNDIYAEVEGVGGTEVGSGQKGKAKLGGILVNTNFVGGKWRIVVGCGINVLNALPTTSLSQLHSLLTSRSTALSSSKPLPAAPTMEGTFAKIMGAFDAKWEQFVEEKGFKGFMDEYHGRWLHSGQEVTLTTTEPHTRLRILSLTPDHGLLRCIALSTTKPSSGLTPLYNRSVDAGEDDRFSSASTPTRAGGGGKVEFVDLQPDGNSFDLMSGMIKRKV